MTISLISTVKDEVKNVDILMNSILSQSALPNEIIIVDAGSKDGTYEKLNSWKSALKNLTVIESKGCNRSEGRNLAIEKSTGDVVAVTDFGCKLFPNWLHEITSPIVNDGYDVTAGYYINEDESLLAAANSFFTHPALFEINENEFLPSTRSIAFKKECWKKIGGFNIRYIFGEDTLFSSTLRKSGFKVYFNKDAKVLWNSENRFFGMVRKMFSYSLWDGKGSLNQRFYFKMGNKIGAGVIMLICSFLNNLVLASFLIFLFFYLFKTFLAAKKKNLAVPSAAVVLVLKPVYNFMQVLGFVFGKIMRFK